MTIYFQNKRKKRFYITFGLESEIHSMVIENIKKHTIKT